MPRSLTVTTPAADLLLLTIEEMRTAAGVTGTGSDAALQATEARVAAAIMAECHVAVGRGAPPTLKQETLTETFFGVNAVVLVLARRHEVEIVSVTVDGVARDVEAVLAEPEAGLLHLLDGNVPTIWRGGRIVVVYKAGFAEVPPELKMAAGDFLRLAWAEKTRDPALKREVIDMPDVERREREYWVGAVPGQSTEGAVPDVVAGQLLRFRNSAFA
jgi:hypothetical protein